MNAVAPTTGLSAAQPTQPPDWNDWDSAFFLVFASHADDPYGDLADSGVSGFSKFALIQQLKVRLDLVFAADNEVAALRLLKLGNNILDEKSLPEGTRQKFTPEQERRLITKWRVRDANIRKSWPNTEATITQLELGLTRLRDYVDAEISSNHVRLSHLREQNTDVIECLQDFSFDAFYRALEVASKRLAKVLQALDQLFKSHDARMEALQARQAELVAPDYSAALVVKKRHFGKKDLAVDISDFHTVSIGATSVAVKKVHHPVMDGKNDKAELGYFHTAIFLDKREDKPRLIHSLKMQIDNQKNLMAVLLDRLNEQIYMIMKGVFDPSSGLIVVVKKLRSNPAVMNKLLTSPQWELLQLSIKDIAAIQADNSTADESGNAAQKAEESGKAIVNKVAAMAGEFVVAFSSPNLMTIAAKAAELSAPAKHLQSHLGALESLQQAISDYDRRASHQDRNPHCVSHHKGRIKSLLDMMEFAIETGFVDVEMKKILLRQRPTRTQLPQQPIALRT